MCRQDYEVEVECWESSQYAFVYLEPQKTQEKYTPDQVVHAKIRRVIRVVSFTNIFFE